MSSKEDSSPTDTYGYNGPTTPAQTAADAAYDIADAYDLPAQVWEVKVEGIDPATFGLLLDEFEVRGRSGLTGDHQVGFLMAVRGIRAAVFAPDVEQGSGNAEHMGASAEQTHDDRSATPRIGREISERVEP